MSLIWKFTGKSSSALPQDKHGNIKKPKIIKSSGIYELDQQVLQAVANSKVSVKRTASTLWLYKKSKFKDAIEFDLNACR